MKPPRKILHLDLDAFFCAVEELRDPSLKGIPFAVGGRPDHRGVVSSCSYAARQFGIHSAMPMAQAIRLCPKLRIVQGNHREYSRVSKEVMKRVRDVTDLVEQLSIDEAFLDVSLVPKRAVDVARNLQQTILRELSLPCSIGVATNKLLAKTANDVGKTKAIEQSREKSEAILIGPPNAITVVLPGEEAAFLAPLHVRALWGVGPKTAERLVDLGVKTIGDIAEFPVKELVRNFGKNGQDLHLRARGIDDRPIVTSHEPKSISQEITFVKDEDRGDILRKELKNMAENISRRLQKSGYIGTTVKLKLRWPDFSTITRQTTLTIGTDNFEIIFQFAIALFEKEWRDGRPVRLIGLGISGLGPPYRQLSLWEIGDYSNGSVYKKGEKGKTEKLNAVVTQLKHRFGDQIVKPASELLSDQETEI